eukprot:COSAG03_NODE_1407_length_4140_cov_3.756001_9_plen_66_part_01
MMWLSQVNTSSSGCYDDSVVRGLGMQWQEGVHDHTTLETCAAACAKANEAIAAIDDGVISSLSLSL